ncbi:titin-like isoform X1 [Cimex lectularius]|uniref:Uncharacterized protein n=1 Tax=Cimex lectularius TaxID=79782 RepID=A0A8I6RVZ2_CIMLE|nr:titin-like isoform X1 [Cimex lectularius]XP_014251126.1 titin-like isoform X1 [Cimex lectularius]XP_024083761.1 titin-like isoform X1 [Cimex lectularius]
MSAMSASSPPAGLMPLSLIAEHKSTVPQSVQPLPRTEKCPPTVQPTPVVNKPNVANGMEATTMAPVPLVVPQQVEISHPITAMETTPPPPLPTPPTHQPNLPCGGKAESNNSHVECSNSTNNNPDRGEESVAEAPVPDMASQLPVSAAVAVPPPAPAIVQPAAVPAAPVQEVVVPEVQESRDEEKVAAFPTAPAVVPEVAEPQQPKEVAKPVSSQLPTQQQNSSEVKAETSTPAPTEASLPSPAQPPASNAMTLSSPVSPSPATSIVAVPVKSELPKSETKVSPRTKRTYKAKSEPKSKPDTVKEDTEEDDDKKPKRKRLPTQIYQSPIPELNIIAKINKIDKAPSKSEDKLIVFYKNEFLAVRNAEGGFYICQAMQNIYRSSSKIKIRWLSQLPNSDVYSPDFYDQTEFDCILTNLSLERIAKGKFKLPAVESQRTESILKRAIDVEKGIADDSKVTEEHPDGLDVSLYRNEDQLKKRNSHKTKKKTGEKSTSRMSKSRRQALKKKAKVTKSEVVKKIAGRALLASKRRALSPAPAPSAPSVPAKKVTKKAVVTQSLPSAKKDTPQLAKKEMKSMTGKRKAPSTTSASVPEKKPRRDPLAKKKSGATGGGPVKGSATATGPAMTRRTLRNAK